jgi:hypothetical protein
MPEINRIPGGFGFPGGFRVRFSIQPGRMQESINHACKKQISPQSPSSTGAPIAAKGIEKVTWNVL